VQVSLSIRVSEIRRLPISENLTVSLHGGIKMDKIAVLIPCYNESLTIAKVVADTKAALPEAVVYVYDNNSTDGTAALASAAGAVVSAKSTMQGKGNVIRRECSGRSTRSAM
jgi:cellulose synthase/poly-beta-1,6-N-acetylglucosamine synthase-like glycosyltransferase